MNIVKMPLSQLKPAPYNPRVNLKPGDVEYEKLKRSIVEFGYVEPIIFNKSTGFVVGGHQRVKVLQALGHEEVDVVIVELDDKMERALNVALNKVGGDWDLPKLKDLLLELDDGSFDMSLSGFDSEELKNLIDQGEGGDEEDAPGEVKFSEELDEASNYVVLKVDTGTDWIQVQTMLGLVPVYSRRKNGSPWSKGTGRVMKWSAALERIKAAA